MCYVRGMKDENPTLWDKRQEVRKTYREGWREGFNVAMWTVIGLGVLTYFLISYLPA